MLSALKRALDKQYAKGKKKSTKTKKYTINGFPHALQVWAYESIPTIIGCDVDKVNDDAIPRMLSIKSDIDELTGMMSTILKHIGLQRKGDVGDRKGFEGLVDHTLESEEVDNTKTEDVDTDGTPNWLRMPKEDDISNGAKHIELKKKGDEDVHTVGTPPWLRFNIELEKPIDVLEKKVEIGL
ncbi:Ulp1-like peptidase [Cucumis melo var. makuwa]|uniref:Ulp1-like peptidase n=1 Tax=Cucumis melo var. makuwa TaxID=1194695 RepID=A0A5D3DS11_CUCMM|nr:Ulp1-like peptidase [Cucumis melo var. makuwa]